jgi:hypothetical protein
MPTAFLATMKRTTARAEHVLGVEQGHTSRQGFWLEGHSLGVLSCIGATDEDASIDGHVIRLGALTKVRIDVTVEWDSFSFDHDSRFGRVLTIEDDQIKLDASPGRAEPEKLREIEDFIDHVLAAIAGT